MIVTGGIGIFIGKKLGDKIPEFTIKIIAATIFMFFGITKLYQTLPSRFLTLQYTSVFACLLAAAVFMLIRANIIKRRSGQVSAYKRQSKELYDYYHHMEQSINQVCLGVDSCGGCKGNACLVGHTKSLIKSGLEDGAAITSTNSLKAAEHKPYNKEQVTESYIMTLQMIKADSAMEDYGNLHEIRKNLERILFKVSIDSFGSWEKYTSSLEKLDKALAERVQKELE
jgi:hypothetical protein